MMTKVIPAALLALSLTAAPAAFAQSPRTGAPGAHAGMAMTQAEQTYAMQTGMVGAVALRTSQVAGPKLTDPRLRSFAESEVTEQETISRILMEHSEMMGQRMAPPQPDPRMAPMIAQLERTPRGPALDRAYLQGQVQGHEQLLRIQEDYIRSGRNMHLRHVAMLARGQITDHLKALRAIEGSMRTAAR